MKIAIVVFDDFTDIDVFMPWDLLKRVSRDAPETALAARARRGAPNACCLGVAFITVPTQYALVASTAMPSGPF